MWWSTVVLLTVMSVAQRTDEVKALELHLSLEDTSFALGEPVEIDVLLANVGAASVDLVAALELVHALTLISVTGPRGPVPHNRGTLSDPAQSELRSRQHESLDDAERRYRVVLPPRAYYGRTIALSAGPDQFGFIFDEPGSYEVQFSMRVVERGSGRSALLESNTITFGVR